MDIALTISHMSKISIFKAASPVAITEALLAREFLSKNKVMATDPKAKESKREQFIERSKSDLLDSASYHSLLAYFDFYTAENLPNKVAWNKVFLYYKQYLLEHSILGESSKFGNESGAFDAEYYASLFQDIGTHYDYTGFYIPLSISHSDFETNFQDDSKKLKDSVKLFMSFPIYGISYELALEYANWTAEEHSKSSLNKSKLQLKGRLMTEQEYETILKKAGPKSKENQTSYPDSLNVEGCLLLNVVSSVNCKSTATKKSMFGENPLAVPISSYNPDKFGLYNIYGNMSEMTMTKGVAKGGSFNNSMKEINYDRSQVYGIEKSIKPENWLGFRVVYEVK
jgi:hypothetical protein